MPGLKGGERPGVRCDRAAPAGLMRLVAALAVIGLAGFSSVVMLREVLRAWRSRYWRAVPGTIVRSHVITTRDADGETHGARVTYRYRVGDAVHESARIRFGGPFDSSIRIWAEKLCEEYPVGSDVRVRVSPADPRTSVLEPGVRWSVALMMAFFVVLWLIGMWLLLKELRALSVSSANSIADLFPRIQSLL